MKGIILAGGSGTRLYPITKATSKQLLNVYDKPMIYYPLSTLMQAGIRDILLITTPIDQASFQRLLGDGHELGIHITYTVQPSPDGLAQAFLLGREFIGDDACAMVLGDNIFYGNGFEELLKNASLNAINGYATIFGVHVKDPERFGIMEIDENNQVLSVEEKPTEPKSDLAITGLYFYPKGVSEKAAQVRPSKRNELEITSLNDMYLQEEKLKACLLGEGYTWFDTGTEESMADATAMIRSIQNNKDKVICCPEAIAYQRGWLTEAELEESVELMKKNKYGKYLKKVLEKGRKN
ncbi:MAG: glucose-1-phosphate thymidylyltransferase RfbA [Erysipelotrichaceae bacterium]|nr:glucose-1-phosphate thymidylyltransferase RfbA [Erysipelotrichaceae bacterium]